MSRPPRFPPIPPAEQSPEHLHLQAEAQRVVLEVFGPNFTLTDASGNTKGPFPPLFYTPETFIPYLRHFHAVVNTALFTAREKELVVLATMSVTQAQYIIYAHKNIGMRLGLEKKQVDDASEGGVPQGLEEREERVFQLALELTKGFGRLDEGSWAEGVRMFGRDGMAALVQIVASYMGSSCLVNCAEVDVPVD